MKINGSLTFLGGGQVKTFTLENLATDPASPALAGRMWFNTDTKKFKGFTGTEIVSLGSDAALTTKVSTLVGALGAGINPGDGSYVAPSGTNFIDTGGSYRGEALLLDAQLQLNKDDIVTANSNISDIQTEMGVLETTLGAGVDTDGSYIAPSGTNYIDGGGSYRGETLALDTQLKITADATATNTSDIATNLTSISTKVSKAGDTMTGNLNLGSTHRVVSLAAPVDNGDAATKGYVDALIAGLDFQHDVHGIQEDITFDPGLTPSLNDRYIIKDAAALNANFGTIAGLENNDIVQYDGTDFYVAYDVSTKGQGALAWNRGTNEFFIYADSIWSSFGGLVGVTAGAGLGKSGNEIWVNFGAGIVELPSDEVGLDTYEFGGLFTTEDGITESVAAGAQLSIKLNGNSLVLNADGLKVADGGVGATQLKSDIAGDGLAGGAGTALTLSLADTSLKVDATGVSINTVWADARYLTLSGGTLTGNLALAGDPVADEDASNKKYVDDTVSDFDTKMQEGRFLYTAGAAAATHTVTHNIGQQYVNVTVIDTNDQVVIPDSITFDSTSQLTVGFLSSVSCKVVCQGVKTV